MTYRQAVYAVLTPLKAVMDDSEITESLALFWVTLSTNKYIASLLKEGDSARSGQYLSQFYPVKVSKDDKDRQYIDIPCAMINVSRDAGIDYMTYNVETCCCEGPQFAQTKFSRTTAGALKSLYEDPHEKPTSTNPYMYIVGGSVNGVPINRIYLLGTECIPLKDVELGLYCSIDPSSVCDLDDNIPVPDEYGQRIIREAIELGRFSHLIPADNRNDGTENINPSGGARQAQMDTSEEQQ